MLRFMRRHLFGTLASILMLLIIYSVTLDGPVYDMITSPVPSVMLTNVAQHHVPSVRSTDAVVFFNGVQGLALAHSVALRPSWAKHGNVVVVQYRPNRFEARVTIATAFRWLIRRGYRRVTLIGISMGGLLAADFIDYNKAHGAPLLLRAILEDVPAGVRTLKHFGAAATTFVHTGVIANLLVKVFGGVPFTPAPPSQWGTGANPEQVKADNHATATWPLSGLVEQVRYIIDHRLPTAGSYAITPMVYVQSTKDHDVSNDSAYWGSVFASHKLVRVVATHSGLTMYPDAYRAGYTRAFGLFPPWTRPSPSSASSAKKPVAQTYLGFFFCIRMR